MYRQAGLLYGHDLHYLDHIAPLCSMLGIPLYVTEELPTSYYPDLEVRREAATDVTEIILQKCDVLFSCLPKQLLDPLFFFDEMKLRKKLLACWLPHGNSDKENLGALAEEKLILFYGKQMAERLPKNKARKVAIGNLRAHFFNMHTKFYQKLLASELQFEKTQKTLFYAPTWDETNVKETLPYLLKHLPPHYNLFVKLHPNTLAKGLFPYLENRSNVRFLTNIPTIYPILAKSDIYIGDHSSIAYDFLYFNRPLFFLTHKRTPIHHTGRTVDLNSLFEAIEDEDTHREARIDLYNYTFAKVDYSMLKKAFAIALEDYFETEVH